MPTWWALRPRCVRHVHSMRFPGNGQVLPESHPHILREKDHLMPGIRAGVFAARRNALLDALPADTLAIVSGYGLRYASRVVL